MTSTDDLIARSRTLVNDARDGRAQFSHLRRLLAEQRRQHGEARDRAVAAINRSRRLLDIRGDEPTAPAGSIVPPAADRAVAA